MGSMALFRHYSDSRCRNKLQTPGVADSGMATIVSRKKNGIGALLDGRTSEKCFRVKGAVKNSKRKNECRDVKSGGVGSKRSENTDRRAVQRGYFHVTCDDISASD